MRFTKGVTREAQELLLEQLKEYEANTPMSKEERKELYKWVSEGRSPYDNGDYICWDGGIPLDFVSALRAEKELRDWFNSLSEEEKEAERAGCHYQYDTENEGAYLNMAAFQIPDSEECDLPFQKRIKDGAIL